MARYIDAEPLIAAFSDVRMQGTEFVPETIAHILETEHAVDAVPVTRCKDCYYQDKMLCYRICQRGFSPVYVEPEGFCKWGRPWGADGYGVKYEKVDEI